MRFSPTFYKMILPRLLFTREILWQYEFILSLSTVHGGLKTPTYTVSQDDSIIIVLLALSSVEC